MLGPEETSFLQQLDQSPQPAGIEPATGRSSTLDAATSIQQDAASAVEQQLTWLRSMNHSELLDVMEDRVTDMMDVSRPYVTPFAKPALPEPTVKQSHTDGGSVNEEEQPPTNTSTQASAEDFRRVLGLLSRQVVHASDNHAVFDPDINQADDSMAVLLTIMYAQCSHS